MPSYQDYLDRINGEINRPGVQMIVGTIHEAVLRELHPRLLDKVNLAQLNPRGSSRTTRYMEFLRENWGDGPQLNLARSRNRKKVFDNAEWPNSVVLAEDDEFALISCRGYDLVKLAGQGGGCSGSHRHSVGMGWELIGNIIVKATGLRVEDSRAFHMARKGDWNKPTYEAEDQHRPKDCPCGVTTTDNGYTVAGYGPSTYRSSWPSGTRVFLDGEEWSEINWKSRYDPYGGEHPLWLKFVADHQKPTVKQARSRDARGRFVARVAAAPVGAAEGAVAR